MNAYLPDVNVLVALIDKEHDHHRIARRWFRESGHTQWLTCATTENGAIRVMSLPSYPRISLTPAQVSRLLEDFRQIGTCRFVSESSSVLNDVSVDISRLLASKQVTDTHLLAQAVHHDAILVTLDRRLSSVAVRNGEHHLLKLL